MRDRPRRLAIRRIHVSHPGRIGAAPGPIIARIGKQLARFGLAAARIEHGRGGLIGEQLEGGLQLRQQAFMHRPQMTGGPADPIGQGRAIQIDALPGIDLRLPVERQMIGVFRHQHLRDQRFGGQAALDQTRRSGRLHHHVLTGAAGVFGPTHDQHAQLRRHDVEPLGDILADAVQGRQQGQAGSSMSMIVSIRGRWAGKDPRFRRRSAARATRLFGSSAFALRLGGGLDLFGLFQPQQQLIFRQALGPAAEAVTLHRLDDLLQPLALARSARSMALSRSGSSGRACIALVTKRSESCLDASRRWLLWMGLTVAINSPPTALWSGAPHVRGASPNLRAERRARRPTGE